MIKILAASSPGEVRVAVWDGRLIDYAIWRPGCPDGVGDLHRGRVTAIARNFGGCFVALDGAEGFLPDSERAAPLTEGEIITVRITRSAQGGKGPRLAQAGPADGPVRLVARGPGAVERLAAAHPAAPVVLDDPALAATLRATLAGRINILAQAFDDAIEDEIAGLAESVAALPGGGRMTIQPTAALVAIDLDAGTALAASVPKTTAHAVFNATLLPELARQIRLRTLSGAILVDFAGLPPRRRAALADPLRTALATDPTECRLVGFTGLGLAEIVRRRVHPPLHELLAGPHAAATTALRCAVAQARPGQNQRLRAAPAVIAAIRQDATMRADLARSAAYALDLKSDPALPNDHWTLDDHHVP